jgi:enamine deaminase RidA (YjgF/YER057c/UK114 family)
MQTHSSPEEFPGALAGETKRLEFHAATYSSVGTLEDQIRAAVEKLFARSHGETVLKLRVFAVGPDDLIAARQIIRHAFASAGRPLPVLSLVGVAALPEHGQKVVVESVIQGKRKRNPFGLAFLAGFASSSGDKTVEGLAKVAGEAGILMQDVTRVSCFYQSPEQADVARASIAGTFPTAESSFVLSVTVEVNPAIECEAVARLSAPSSDGVRYFNLSGTKASPYFSRAALVSTNRLVFTGTEVALGDSEQDAREPFERAKEAVERLGAGLPDVVMGNNYWVTAAARDRNREVRGAYFGQTVPAASGVFFASVTPAQATQAIEFTVAVPNTGTLSRPR